MVIIYLDLVFNYVITWWQKFKMVTDHTTNAIYEKHAELQSINTNERVETAQTNQQKQRVIYYYLFARQRR